MRRHDNVFSLPKKSEGAENNSSNNGGNNNNDYVDTRRTIRYIFAHEDPLILEFLMIL